ncbi:MAG: hypothetical protein QME64_00285 [bacterium]|nr:hypothetical protein [bacterium]
MKIRFTLLVAAILLLGIILSNLVFAQEGQPPRPPSPGKVWVWEPAHWELEVAWRPSVPPPPPTPPPVPAKLKKYWRWVPAKWVLVNKPPEGPCEWKPASLDPIKKKWVKGAWVKITILPQGKVWIAGSWDPVKRIWIAGHWEAIPAPPPPPPVVKPPPPPPELIPPKPAYPPRPGYHWEWDPVLKRWVQRRIPAPEVRPPPPLPPPPVVKPPPPEPIPPKPAYPPRIGFEWEWDPVLKRWVQRRIPPPEVRPPPPLPPPPVVKPPPLEPIPPKPAYPPKIGFEWEWNPVLKKWVERRNP